jgi:hypothetical protein
MIHPAAATKVDYFNIILIVRVVFGIDSEIDWSTRSPGMYELEVKPYKFG